MSKFIITERIPTFQIWVYEVEAESETEALEQVLNGDVTASDITTDEPDYSLAEYEIEDEEGNVYDVERDGEDENINNTQDNESDEYNGVSWDTQTK